MAPCLTSASNRTKYAENSQTSPSPKKSGEWIASDQLEHEIENPVDFKVQSFLIRLRMCSSKSLVVAIAAHCVADAADVEVKLGHHFYFSLIKENIDEPLAFLSEIALFTNATDQSLFITM